jgi:hypothetical protein
MSSVLKFIYSDKVEIKAMSGLPVYLLNFKFEHKPEIVSNKQRVKEYIRYCDASFNRKFWNLIWLCYRKNFAPLLTNDMNTLQDFLELRPEMLTDKKRVAKIGATNDVGWGCAIRVGQMMFCHTILRHRLGDAYS